MHSTKGLSALAAILHLTIVTLLLGILNYPDILLVLPVTPHIPQAMTEGGSQPFEDSRQKKAVSPAQATWSHIDDVVIFNGQRVQLLAPPF